MTFRITLQTARVGQYIPIKGNPTACASVAILPLIVGRLNYPNIPAAHRVTTPFITECICTLTTDLLKNNNGRKPRKMCPVHASVPHIIGCQ